MPLPADVLYLSLDRAVRRLVWQTFYAGAPNDGIVMLISFSSRTRSHMSSWPRGVGRALPCRSIGLLGVRVVGRIPNPQGARTDERGWDLHLARDKSTHRAHLAVT